MVRIVSKNQRTVADYGKNSETLVTDSSRTNCPEENFEQLELDLPEGMEW
jgi:hypothetical protein